MPAARLPCSPCQGASGKFGKLLLLFSFFYDLNNVLMSNPCGAVQQAAAPHYFAINCNGTGGFRLNETMPTGYELAHQQAETIFRHVFPRQGMTVREGQIQLCHTMLDALFGREVALCDPASASARPIPIWWPLSCGCSSVHCLYGSHWSSLLPA